MKKGVIIVDFDNWFKKSISDYTDVEIEFEFKQLVEELTIGVPNIEDVEIRLYGGWYNNDILTNMASELQLLLARIYVFPWITSGSSTIVKGKIVLTSSINDFPSYQWFNTVKEKRGIASLRIDNNNLTAKCIPNRGLCPPFILKKFTSRKNKICSVTDCGGVHHDIFRRLEQKMVDTMIACDIISYCESMDYGGILLASEDIDHFPALAMGSLKLNEKSKPIDSLGVAIKNSSIKNRYDDILKNFNLKTTTLV